VIARKRHYVAGLVYSYLAQQQIDNARVTARDIVRYHHLPKKASHSISAFLNGLYLEGSTYDHYGVFVAGREQDKKGGAPYSYYIKLLGDESTA
jgi:hypothetical protein